MSRFFIQCAYNGTAYHGWQSQHNAISVQSVIEKALSTLLKETITIIGAGRTDTGVHALEYFAHFDTELNFDSEHLVFKLNSFLSDDIAIKKIFQVTDDAHARFSAISRTYCYHVLRNKNPFLFDTSFYVYGHLNIEAMNKAAAILMNYKDFTSFSKTDTDTKTNDCTIFSAKWTEVDDLLIFEITANRFLRNMVRAIVGTLLEVGMGKKNPEDIEKIILSKNRSEAGYSVPAKGLFLRKIDYSIQVHKSTK